MLQELRRIDHEIRSALGVRHSRPIAAADLAPEIDALDATESSRIHDLLQKRSLLQGIVDAMSQGDT
jgi:hypothetical protein